MCYICQVTMLLPVWSSVTAATHAEMCMNGLYIYLAVVLSLPWGRKCKRRIIFHWKCVAGWESFCLSRCFWIKLKAKEKPHSKFCVSCMFFFFFFVSLLLFLFSSRQEAIQLLKYISNERLCSKMHYANPGDDSIFQA